MDTGETTEIDSCIYTIYQQYLRAGIYTQFRTVKDDWKLHKLVLQWLYFIYMKAIGSNNIFSDKQKDLLKLLLYYFYTRFCLFKDHHLAIDLACKHSKLDELYNEFKAEFELFKRYTVFNDIFKAIKDLKIVNTSVSVMIMDCIKKFQINGYYTITGTIDVVISGSIISLYPVRFVSNLFVNSNIQKSIEKIVLKYCKKVKIDKNPLLYKC